ncbi:MAG: TIGR04133 family radical SAM/SPASM protein [Marinilabiliales bacterium]
MNKNRVYPTIRQKIGLNIFSKYVKLQARLHELNYFFWECTLRCNIKCRHCGSDCRQDTSITDMPADDFLNITEKVAKHYNPNKIMIVITGGEPLVRKDLEYVGSELYKQGYPWGFVTNGIALSEERFKTLMQSGLRSITISLDGLEESHNWLRGHPNSFNKAVNAIKLVVKEPDLVYDVVTCVTQKNINELEQVKELLMSLGVKKWRIFTIDPIGRAKNDPELNLSPSQFKNVLDFIAKTRKEKKIKIDYGCEGFVGSYETKVRDGFFFCRAGINIASILCDGSIGACPNNSPEIIQGNIYQDDFMDVWNNRFEIMRNFDWKKTGQCKDCDMFKWCRGNGLHLHDFENHDVLRCHYKMLKEANS